MTSYAAQIEKNHRRPATARFLTARWSGHAGRRRNAAKALSACTRKPKSSPPGGSTSRQEAAPTAWTRAPIDLGLATHWLWRVWGRPLAGSRRGSSGGARSARGRRPPPG
jgi:hypothetical protein